jgi:hypothetical protein
VENRDTSGRGATGARTPIGEDVPKVGLRLTEQEVAAGFDAEEASAWNA